MEWNEYHHAWIVSEFYRLFMKQFGERGKCAFIQAAQTYGEQRGKRMAMRSIADGQTLDFRSYFAYGEYSSTDAFFEVQMWGEPGVVNEKVSRCPWADLFARRGLKDCGEAYCREIDRAIVRGFNPELELETRSTQHYGDCCRFYFRHPAVTQEILEQAEELTAGRRDIALPLSYHCAHVFHVFKAVAEGVFGTEGEAVVKEVLRGFSAEYGKTAADFLSQKADGPFDTIMNLEEWLDDNTDGTGI